MLLIVVCALVIIFAFLALVLSFLLDQSKAVEKSNKDAQLFMIHELRSPIASIKAAANLILTQDLQLTPEKKEELLKVINSQSIKMLDQISLLLDTAKLQSGMFLIQKTTNDIEQIINERVDLYMPLAVEKNVPIDVKILHPIPPFMFDKQYIGQVMSNLISNSLKFTPHNGRITITADFDGKQVIISVADTGSGLTKEQQENLFHKFDKVRQSETMNGSGLGLYFTKGIVAAHKGTITAHSVLNEGTTITFTLPFINA